jgi:hypothetical protein
MCSNELDLGMSTKVHILWYGVSIGIGLHTSINSSSSVSVPVLVSPELMTYQLSSTTYQSYDSGLF